jgi:hypothetical protein
VPGTQDGRANGLHPPAAAEPKGSLLLGDSDFAFDRLGFG